jgi:uncharacterized protein
MPLSRYARIYPSGKDSEEVILFSTKTAAIVELPETTIIDISSSQLAGEDAKTLKKLRFLVDDPEEEKKEMMGFIEGLNDLNRSLNIKLAMNLDCNLACRYCFEGRRKGQHYMTKETADEFIELLTRKTAVGGLEEIQITFYGGEPLLSLDLIQYISEKAKSVAEMRGLFFNTYLMTNGTLLTKVAVGKLKPLGLREAYITVDGPKENHNGFRPYKSGRGSFDAIIRNVQDACGRIDIQLGGNFTRRNYHLFPELLYFYLENGLSPDKVRSVGFSPVLAEDGEFGPPDFPDGCCSIGEPWLFEASVFLREETLKCGYRSDRISPRVCMMEYKNNLLVNYDGSIYKCPGLIGRKDFCVGNIKEGIKDCKAPLYLDNWQNEECLECVYLPLCFGGCRAMKLVRDGNMNGVDCKKPYLDATLEAMVKQDIKYGLV